MHRYLPEESESTCKINKAVYIFVCIYALMKVAVNDRFSSWFSCTIFAGHLEKRFGITAEDWKQTQLHIDSKCRSAYRCKSRGLPQTVRAFHRQNKKQTARCVRVNATFHELGAGFAETCTDDAEPQSQQNSLIAEVGFH